MNAFVANVCPKAPPGMGPYVDMIMGWTKWGVLSLIIIAGFISVGMIVAGRLGNMQRAGSMGASGLVVVVVAAILFVTIYGVIIFITGAGCP